MNKDLKEYLPRAKEVYDLKELERLGLTPTLEQREIILIFFCMLFKWNPVANLISSKDEAVLFLRHFCDSLQPMLRFGFKKNAQILDIGSGGGFPVIPIKVFRPDLCVTLAESNRKKATFLSETIKACGFEKMTVHNGRVEKLDAEHSYDYVISRGLGTLQKFSHLAKPFVSPDGRMYTFKARSFDEELASITENKHEAGVRISEIAEYDLANQILGLKLVSLELMPQ